MFTLTLEFYHSEFGHTDSFPQAIVGATLMGLVSFIKAFRDSRLIEGCYLLKNKAPKNDYRHDYVNHVYTHIHLLLTSLLAPVVSASFLKTFSTMTITVGSKDYMQILSYVAIIAMSYCANILAKNNEPFELLYEPIMEVMESWAFFHETYLNVITHEQPIDRVMFYYYYSDDPLIFAAMLAFVRVFYSFYQLSASKLPHEIKHTLKSPKKRCALTVAQMTYIAAQHPKSASNGDYQLVLQADDANDEEVTDTKYNIGDLKGEDVDAILLRSSMGGHHLNELFEYFTTSKKASSSETVSAVNPHAQKAKDEAAKADKAYELAIRLAHQCTVKSATEASKEASKAICAATTLIELAANTHHLACAKHHLGKEKKGEYISALVSFEDAKRSRGLAQVSFDRLSSESEQAKEHANEIENALREARRRAAQTRRQANQADAFARLARNVVEAGDKEAKVKLIAADSQSRSDHLIHEEKEADNDVIKASDDAAKAKQTAIRADEGVSVAKTALAEAERVFVELEDTLKTIADAFAQDDSKQQADEAACVSDEIRHLMEEANELASQASQEAEKYRKRPYLDDATLLENSDFLSALSRQETEEGKRTAAQKQYDAYMAKPKNENPIIKASFGADVEGTAFGALITAPTSSSPTDFKIEAPTASLIFLLLAVGSIPFTINLIDAIDSALSCANYSNYVYAQNISKLTCVLECDDLYPERADLQDIGSSWFVLVCQVSILIACVNFASLGFKKELTQRFLSCRNSRCDQPQFPPKSWLVPAVFAILSIPSFVLAVLTLGQWLSILEANAELSVACSSDAPFVVSRRELKAAGYLCVALGVATLLPLPLYAVIMAIHGRARCRAIRDAQSTAHHSRVSTYVPPSKHHARARKENEDIELRVRS